MLQKFFRLTMLVAGLALVASPASAAPKKKAAKKGGKASAAKYEDVPWGMAGCGLWTYVIKEKDQGPQLGVWALRHVVFDSQTSAISSGTSNCVHARSDVAQREQEVFITVNLNSLSTEAAQGGGEHITALAEVFGCPQTAFAALSQKRYGDIYGATEPRAVLDNYRRELTTDATMAGTCVRAS